MSDDPFTTDTSARIRQRLWGFAVLLALLVIFLPQLLDGSGSESKFPRVEKLRHEPPIREPTPPGTEAAALSTNSGSNILPSTDEVVNTAGTGAVAGGLNDSGGGNSRLANGRVNGSESLSNAGVTDHSTASLNSGSTVDSGVIEDTDTRDSQPTGQLPNEQGDLASGQVLDETSGQLSNANGGSAVATNERDTAVRGTPGETPENVSGAGYMSESGANAPAAVDLTAWVVMAGAYRQERSAVAVRDRLRNEGFASFVREPETPDDLFQVLVGPMIKEQGAFQAQAQVADLLGNSPVIMSYP